MDAVPISVSVSIDGVVFSAQTVGDPHDSDTALDLARSVVKALLGYGGDQPEGLVLAIVSGSGDVGRLFRDSSGPDVDTGCPACDVSPDFMHNGRGALCSSFREEL